MDGDPTLNWLPLLASALVGAFVTAFGAGFTFWLEGSRRKDENSQRVRIARMALANQLHDFAKHADEIFVDLSNVENPLGRSHTSLPVPPFLADLQHIAVLPTKEGEGQIKFARDIVRANQHVELEWTIEGEDDAFSLLSRYAAEYAIKAVDRHDDLAAKIGWEKYPLSAERRVMFQKAVDEWLARDRQRQLDQEGILADLATSDPERKHG